MQQLKHKYFPWIIEGNKKYTWLDNETRNEVLTETPMGDWRLLLKRHWWRWTSSVKYIRKSCSIHPYVCTMNEHWAWVDFWCLCFCVSTDSLIILWWGTPLYRKKLLLLVHTMDRWQEHHWTTAHHILSFLGEDFRFWSLPSFTWFTWLHFYRPYPLMIASKLSFISRASQKFVSSEGSRDLRPLLL